MTPHQVRKKYLRSRIFPVPPSPREDDTVDDAGELAALEAEMAAERAQAGARLRAALGWLREADEDLSALTRPSWGREVASWHRAREALEDATEAYEAWERFG
jgi:hypothetical protein